MRRVAARIATTQGARIVVFGHTHHPWLETLKDNTTLINCGSWQWLGGCDPTEDGAWQEMFTHPTQVVPRHRLSYTRIEYDEQDFPHARLLEFTDQ